MNGAILNRGHDELPLQVRLERLLEQSTALRARAWARWGANPAGSWKPAAAATAVAPAPKPKTAGDLSLLFPVLLFPALAQPLKAPDDEIDAELVAAAFAHALKETR